MSSKILKSLELEENELSDEGFVEMNSEITPVGFGRHGYAALGATMKRWESPSLMKLDVCASHLDDDGLQALVEGMSNCFNLERLNLSENKSITVVGLRAIPALFRSKKFCLLSLDMRCMEIDVSGVTALAAGLGSLQSLKSLDLAYNAIGDEGLQYLAAGLASCSNFENLNGSFSAMRLRSLCVVFPTALNLKELCLRSNSISDEGLQALAVGMTNHCNLERLDLSK